MGDLQFTEGGKVLKMEVDYAETVKEKIPHCEKLVKDGKVNEALEILFALEKQTRTDGDSHSTTKVLIAIVKFLFESGNIDLLIDSIVQLCKRRSQLKLSMTKMIQECCTYVDQITDYEKKLKFMNTLLSVTDGKIHVELERARLTYKLALIYESEGKINEAAHLMQELQVETFGSIEKKEKVELILEQMRLSLSKNDFIKTQIISKKIHTKYFEDKDVQDLKLKYYQLMIQVDQHETNYFKICQHYRAIYNTPVVKDDPLKRHEALKYIVLYAILAPHDNEQHDLMHRVRLEKDLEELPVYKNIIEKFTTNEIIDRVELLHHFKEILQHGKDASMSDTFSNSEEGTKRFKDLTARIDQHNIRVMAKYYRRIRLSRMAQLLRLNPEETEEELSNLVVKKTIWAKVDRLEGIVNFEQHKDPNEVLNDWSYNINKLMGLVCKINHLIGKEEMIHRRLKAPKEGTSTA